jgi:succinyl-CoA synthetase alpha subunit
VARVFGFRFGKNYLIPRPVVARFLAGEVSREEGERIAHELSVINAESERKASRGRR